MFRLFCLITGFITLYKIINYPGAALNSIVLSGILLGTTRVIFYIFDKIDEWSQPKTVFNNLTTAIEVDSTLAPVKKGPLFEHLMKVNFGEMFTNLKKYDQELLFAERREKDKKSLLDMVVSSKEEHVQEIFINHIGYYTKTLAEAMPKKYPKDLIELIAEYHFLEGCSSHKETQEFIHLAFSKKLKEFDIQQDNEKRILKHGNNLRKR